MQWPTQPWTLQGWFYSLQAQRYIDADATPPTELDDHTWTDLLDILAELRSQGIAVRATPRPITPLVQLEHVIFDEALLDRVPEERHIRTFVPPTPTSPQVSFVSHTAYNTQLNMVPQRSPLRYPSGPPRYGRSLQYEISGGPTFVHPLSQHDENEEKESDDDD